MYKIISGDDILCVRIHEYRSWEH